MLEQQEAEEREREERRERKKAKKVFSPPPIAFMLLCLQRSCGAFSLVYLSGWSPSQSEATAAGMIHKSVECDPGKHGVSRACPSCNRSKY